MKEIKINVQRLENVLEKLFLFKSLEQGMKERFIDESVLVIAEKDETLIEEGALENTIYIEGAKVHITDAASHPYNVEFLRFETGSPMHELVQTRTHVGYIVPDLDEALKGQTVIVEPFDATEELRVAFITDGDAVLELMEER